MDQANNFLENNLSSLMLRLVIYVFLHFSFTKAGFVSLEQDFSPFVYFYTILIGNLMKFMSIKFQT